MRARNIKPGFFKNEDLAECSACARLLFAGLWCYGDRKGRFEWRPKRIKIELLPYDDVDIDKLLEELMERHFITFYSHNGRDYGYVNSFTKHQNPHINERDSILPEPNEHHTSTVQVSDKHSSNQSDSLIPDSLIPDSKKEAMLAVFVETDKLAEQMKIGWDKVFAFVNAMRKQKKHPGAIFLALTQVALHNPKEPWPYAKNIVTVESQNFYEQDHARESEKHKEKR